MEVMVWILLIFYGGNVERIANYKSQELCLAAAEKIETDMNRAAAVCIPAEPYS